MQRLFRYKAIVIFCVVAGFFQMGGLSYAQFSAGDRVHELLKKLPSLEQLEKDLADSVHRAIARRKGDPEGYNRRMDELAQFLRRPVAFHPPALVDFQGEQAARAACVPGKAVYDRAGTYTLKLPAACGSVLVKLWGAGGASAAGDRYSIAGGTVQKRSYSEHGGTGGYTTSIITLPNTGENTEITIIVGGRGGKAQGTDPGSGGYNGGGTGGRGIRRAGENTAGFIAPDTILVGGAGGGGSTEILLNKNRKAVAGGGGGASLRKAGMPGGGADYSRFIKDYRKWWLLGEEQGGGGEAGLGGDAGYRESPYHKKCADPAGRGEEAQGGTGGSTKQFEDCKAWAYGGAGGGGGYGGGGGGSYAESGAGGGGGGFIDNASIGKTYWGGGLLPANTQDPDYKENSATSDHDGLAVIVWPVQMTEEMQEEKSAALAAQEQKVALCDTGKDVSAHNLAKKMLYVAQGRLIKNSFVPEKILKGSRQGLLPVKLSGAEKHNADVAGILFARPVWNKKAPDTCAYFYPLSDLARHHDLAEVYADLMVYAADVEAHVISFSENEHHPMTGYGDKQKKIQEYADYAYLAEYAAGFMTEILAPDSPDKARRREWSPRSQESGRPACRGADNLLEDLVKTPDALRRALRQNRSPRSNNLNLSHNSNGYIQYPIADYAESMMRMGEPEQAIAAACIYDTDERLFLILAALSGNHMLLLGNRQDFRLYQLQDIDLSGINLSGMRAGGMWRNVRFGNAILTGASFSNMHLENVDFSQSDLSNVQFVNIYYDETTIWPPGFTPPEAPPRRGRYE